MKITLFTGVALIAVGAFGFAGNTFASGTHAKPHAPKVQKQKDHHDMHNDGHGHMKKAAPGHGHDDHDDDDEHASKAGEPGNPKKPARIVLVTMREGDGKMFFTPNNFTIHKGEQIRFKIKNAGVLAHEFVIGEHNEIMAHHKVMQKFPDMEHDDPNSIRLEEKKSGEVLWRFTNVGTFEFACLIPGHMEAGMKGVFTVKTAATN